MKHFLRLLEEARVGVADMTVEQTDRRRRPLTDEEWNMLEKCRPFVFYYEGEEYENISLQDEDRRTEKIDAPFAVFSVEVFGDDHFVSSVTDKHGKVAFWIECLVSIEVSVSSFVFFSLAKFSDGQRILYKEPPQMMAIAAKKFLNKISRESIGIEKVKLKTKVGNGKSKKEIIIRKIVHVSPNRLEYFENQGREVDWSHRWLVRGHWRKVNLLGKDREGNYCVNGFTWVQDHEKGPEDLPLIADKTRVIVSPKAVK